MNDFYGNVEIETAGVDQRDTDALECLFALCRIMGLRYEITKWNDKYQVGISWSSWPTDFFVPQKREGKYVIVGATNPVDALRSAISGAVNELRRNGEAYQNGFKEYWKKDTGYDWVRNEQGCNPPARS